MLLRLVALDSNSKDGWYDWRASEIRNHPNGGLHASISAQSRAGANVSFEPASITRPSQSSIAMSASNLFALLNVFLQFAREMNGGGTISFFSFSFHRFIAPCSRHILTQDLILSIPFY
mmetsp:Transcript_6112/g.10848  ORF Transcript_6112/g.10848 Transcript_6112/m.10848 type:complete len:119 (+) Transcript_6112:2934-3290(+)